MVEISTYNSLMPHLLTQIFRMYFDFSMTYIGAGIICPHIVNVSVLLGAILSWCLLWPLIASYEGIWYPAGLGSSNFKGLYGYKVFIAIAVILGDGLYNFIVILYKSGKELHAHYASHNQLPVSNAGAHPTLPCKFTLISSSDWFLYSHW